MELGIDVAVTELGERCYRSNDVNSAFDIDYGLTMELHWVSWVGPHQADAWAQRIGSMLGLAHGISEHWGLTTDGSTHGWALGVDNGSALGSNLGFNDGLTFRRTKRWQWGRSLDTVLGVDNE